MGIQTLHIPNSRLTEGETYPFKILNILSLGDHDDYFVMRDPLGYKIMMPMGYYLRYGFEPGQTVACRVDKINCNGRMFLEPKHPFYTEGRVYTFEVVASGSSKNILDQPIWYLLVKDLLGYEWKVISQSDAWVTTNPSHIECLIQRIKKGKLYLQIAGEEIPDQHLMTGRTYDFCLTDERINPDDGLSYYILEDQLGRKHMLRKKYYMHYGYKRGDHIRCKVLKTGADATLLLEPEHPCYQVGDVADFTLDRIEQLKFSDGSHQKVLVFSDCLGEDVKVHVDDDLAARYLHANPGQVKAKVTHVYKSRLELEICPQP